MPQFNVNAHRFDPYRNFKFKVKWDGQPVAGLSKCSALKKKTEVVDWREGGDPTHGRKLPGKTSYEPITLEKGVTHDPAFEDWANLVNNFSADAAMSLKNFRKEMIIDMCNLQGAVVLSYVVHRAWVSDYTALPDLDSNGNAVAIQSIVLQNEGWERDLTVTEPAET
jgi:phage tail-like protein